MTIRIVLLSMIALNACAVENEDGSEGATTMPLQIESIASFDQPWAMTFLPDGTALVSEKRGKLILIDQGGEKLAEVSGVPDVDNGGQGGFGDVIVHPNFSSNRVVYVSYAEAGDGDTRGAAVARATLAENDGGLSLQGLTVIWRQVPKVTGRGHYGHRLAFSPDGFLFISSGDRQKFTPSQDMNSNLGKVLRLNDGGGIPENNPFFEKAGVTAEIWSLGHRNPLGLAFDQDGQLWNMEMGPRHGDELNRVVRGANYGYPLVSNGDHYNGDEIPDHDTRPDLSAPAAYWVPAISPGGFIFYNGTLFPKFRGNAFIGGLGSRALIRVEVNGETAREAQRYEMGKRIREVEEGPDGAIWLLEDGEGGRLLRLTPSK